jgi:hypothetical protein
LVEKVKLGPVRETKLLEKLDWPPAAGALAAGRWPPVGPKKESELRLGKKSDEAFAAPACGKEAAGARDEKLWKAEERAEAGAAAAEDGDEKLGKFVGGPETGVAGGARGEEKLWNPEVRPEAEAVAPADEEKLWKAEVRLEPGAAADDDDGEGKLFWKEEPGPWAEAAGEEEEKKKVLSPEDDEPSFELDTRGAGDGLNTSLRGPKNVSTRGSCRCCCCCCCSCCCCCCCCC